MGGPLQLYLVPGFFGFVNFGELVYFTHVREFLQAELSTRGYRVEIRQAAVSPTASITKRATELFRFIRDSSADGEAPIHIVGHSTGGLDARLLATPNVALSNEDQVESVASRIESITSITTPHRGTPLASYFTGLLGQRLLRLLSLATVEILREGRIPVAVLAKIGATLARFRLPGSKSAQVLDHLYDELLGQLPEGQRDQISRFFEDVSSDQALLPQLTPAGLDLFNAGATDRDTIRYGSVVAKTERPSLAKHLRFRTDVGRHAQYVLFHWLHRAVGDIGEIDLPRPTDEQRELLLRAYGALPKPDDNDAIVPTWSQIHGRLLFAAVADHLDLIGHFDDESHHPPHRDWITTQSGFSRGSFEALWTTVADFIASPQ